LLQRPGLLNSAAGLLTTIINIYTARNGFWSVTAIVTAAITCSCTTFLLTLFLVYDTWLLKKVKEDHELALEAERRRKSRREVP